MSESDFVMVDRPEREDAAGEVAATKVGETPATEEPKTTQEHEEEVREKEEEEKAEEEEKEGSGDGGAQPESDSDDDAVTEPQATEMAAGEDAPAPEPKQDGEPPVEAAGEVKEEEEEVKEKEEEQEEDSKETAPQITDEDVSPENAPEQDAPNDDTTGKATQNGDSAAAQKDDSEATQSENAAQNEATTAQNGDAGGQPEMERESQSPLPGMPIHIGEYLQLMTVGSDMVKVKKSKTYPRIYWLESDMLGIIWNSRTKKGGKARISIQQMLEIRSGRSTEAFQQPMHAGFDENKCFSIIYTTGGKHQTLDLVALCVSDAVAWRLGLEALIRSKDSGQQRSKVRERWLRELFEEADRNGDGTLDLREVVVILRRLNVGVSKKVIRQKFKEADTEGSDQRLDFEEFCTLFKQLASRPEVGRLFQLYSSKREWLTAEDLQRFMEVEQGVEGVTVEKCAQLISQYEATDQGKLEGLMSVDGFTHFLLGPENDLFNIDHRQVYQDMTQPLSHYHISSSHNTYLLEDQLRGPSSVEAYIRALRKGCRCVELDCWDGDDGEPVIYHGHTLTSKILFKDAILAIKEHAFVASPYPVILSIENHCSIPQQTKMAEYFEEIFGDLLYKDPVDQTLGVLPSPEALKGKILIKGKKLSAVQEEEEDGGEVSDEDEAADVDTSKIAGEKELTPEAEEATAKEEKKEGEGMKEKGGEKEKGGAKEGEGAASEEATAAVAEKKPEGARSLSPEPQSAELAPRKRTLSFRKKRQQPATGNQKKKVKLSVRLSKCINYVQSIHFKGFDDWGEQGQFYQMSSFGESSAIKFSSRGYASHFMLYNKKQLSRTYPSGRRVDSSNYSPVDMWNSGCQIVALNYQTQDLAMDLNDGKFQQNGSSGYVLKPRMMREDLSRFDFHLKAMPGLQPKLYIINVISAQTLPKPPAGRKTGEVIDPYIVINTFGRTEDQHQFKTKAVQDNGFNPEWNEAFTFVVQAPEYTHIRFKVMDKDWGFNVDDFIGQFSVPLGSILPGYRHIHLTSTSEPASIYLHVHIQDYVAPIGRVRGRNNNKRSREYPTITPVGIPAIDTVFTKSFQFLRISIDCKEDYLYMLREFKSCCGCGPQANILDCIHVMSLKAKGFELPLHFQIEGEKAELQVYKAAVSTEVKVPNTLMSMMTAFNVLNGIIRVVLEIGDDSATELEKAYNECLGYHDDLKQHLRTSGAKSHKIAMTLENYGFIMCSMTFLASDMRELKKKAEADLKKIFAASQKYDIELKTIL